MPEFVLRPVPEADARGSFRDPSPEWGRDVAVKELMQSDWRRRGVDQRAQTRTDAYFANFTLGAASDGHLVATDSLGDPIPIPPDLAAMQLVRVRRPRAYVTPFHNALPMSSWLVFTDRDGLVRLLLPGYGWDPINHLANQLQPATSIALADPVAVTIDSKWASLERSHPGWTTAVLVPLGKGPITLTPSSRRFDEDLRFA